MKSYRHSESTKLKISIARTSKLKPPKEILYEMYVTNNMSSSKIAEIIGVTRVGVLKWMESYGIPRRTYREASYGNSRALGHKKSEWAKEQVGKAHRGKELSVHHRENISRAMQSRLGAEEWHGFAHSKGLMERQRFSNVVRKRVLLRDNFTCAMCQKVGGKLHVDHIKPWSTHPDKRFDMDNCITLCVPCHYEKTFNMDYHDGAKNWGNTKPTNVGDIQ